MRGKHPAVAVLGFSEAAMFLRGADGGAVKAIISIHGEREFGVEARGINRLDLFFDDIGAADQADPIACYHARMRAAADSENGLTRAPPTIEDARRILQFADAIRGLDGVVLCHCSGGVSRSPAAALLCLAAWTGPGCEPYCVENVRRARPCSMPHEDMVRFGDALLGRGGALIRALQLAESEGDLR